MKLNDKTITIINRLKSIDSATRQDVYHKTIVHDCAWYTSVESNVQGTTVSMGSKHRVMIPFSKKYLQYHEWKKDGMQDAYYTMNETDIIILGEVTEEVNNQTITKIKQAYEPNVCDVRVVVETEDRGLNGVLFQLVCEGV